MATPRTTRVCILIGISVSLILGVRVFLKRPAHRQPDLPEMVDSSRESNLRPKATEDRLNTPLSRSTTTPKAKIYAQIRNSIEAFRSNLDDGRAVPMLRELRDLIRQAPEEEAAAAIVAFLKTGDDATTRLPFVVGPDGMMETVPSVRLALLDLLPSLDPEEALALARELMDQRTSAEEYALSLRNMAWNDLDGDLRDELSRRFLDMLKSPWLDQPSAGFLEAFDIAVEIGGGPMFDRMVSLADEAMAKSNPAASRAAFMSLDRMVVRDHAPLIAAFSANAGWMDFAPQQRASLLSRLDITDPVQRNIFNSYLSTSHAAGELEYFAKIFPNENFLYGHRLVTADEATPTIDEVRAADAKVLGELDAVEAAVPDDAKGAIQSIRERLEMHSTK